MKNTLWNLKSKWTKQAQCGVKGTVQRLRGYPGRPPGTCKWDHDKLPWFRTGCKDGNRHHSAYGSLNHDINNSVSRADSARWYADLARYETNGEGGLWSAEMGSNDGHYSLHVQENWLAALRVAEMEGKDGLAGQIGRRVFWGWALWSMMAVRTPRKHVVWIDPRGESREGPASHVGPGLSVAFVGMRWKPNKIMVHDQDPALSWALDWRPRSSRFGNREMSGPWPIWVAALQAWEVNPGQLLSGPKFFDQHVQAAAMGLDRDKHQANYRRNLLQRVILDDPGAISELVRLAEIEGITPCYRIYRDGRSTNNGAKLLITATSLGREVIWIGDIVCGNHHIQTAYRSIDIHGKDTIATPMLNSRGSWSVVIDGDEVHMEPHLSGSGGRITVPRLRGSRLWSLEVSPDGFRLL